MSTAFQSMEHRLTTPINIKTSVKYGTSTPYFGFI